MNMKSSQPTAPPHHTETPSSGTGADQSDTKEIIYLASGLLILVFGIGGLLMYSEEAPLPATASQEIDRKEMANAFTSTDSQPTVSNPLTVSQALAEEPLTNSVIPIPGPAENQPQEGTDVYFGFNQWTLSDEAKDSLKARMENRPEGWTGTLRIVGHTDAQGTDAYNKALGLKRAKSVKTYLVALGIPEADVQVETLGKEGSICQEETPECFEQNRRAHVALLPASPSEGEDLQLSMAPSDTSSPAGGELVPATDESAIVPSDPEVSLQEEVQEESVSSDPLLTVESLP
ncbi:MAG TPA: hypothetical protein DD706_00955 [Nitrospiraceae bacterium]|nr:hypothetical protein [Nitrospiraceae bacterium]